MRIPTPVTDPGVGARPLADYRARDTQADRLWQQSHTGSSQVGEDARMSRSPGPSWGGGQQLGYWDRPENQPSHPNFWSPGPTGSRLPRGVLTRTARASFVSFLMIACALILNVVTLVLDQQVHWSRLRSYWHLAAPILFALLAWRYLRSWRLLSRSAVSTAGERGPQTTAENGPPLGAVSPGRRRWGRGRGRGCGGGSCRL